MRLVGILLIAMFTVACAEVLGVGVVAAPTTMAPAPTTTVPRETTTVPPDTTTAPADPVEAGFRTWVEVVARGDLATAWEMLAPESRTALGSFEVFASMATDLAEGWGAWAHSPDLYLVVDRNEDGGVMVVVRGTLEQEGMRSVVETLMPVVEAEGRVFMDPFRGWKRVELPADEVPVGDHYPVPENSGSGRRIVYSNSDQRVWLVEGDGTVVDTYLVSGRKGVPAPGTYQVYSKSETAHAGHDGITMTHMVRFARGERLPIGFHAIPRDANGRPLQSTDQLGEYASAGCVRQSDDKAKLLYEWAEVGTTVVVLA